jgi:methionyl-tRNA synthetase
MPNKNKFYFTTTLPYVNADPHLGFALELTQADIIARYHALLGDEILLNTGTDEHGLKIYRQALAQGKETQVYVDEYATKFRQLPVALGLTEKLNFIRTTDKHHLAAAQEFWRRATAAGDIYKKNYKIKYCVGCELEKTDCELIDGRCPLHPNLELEIIEEENYFFKFSKYQKPLLELYEKNPNFVIPQSRQNEIRAFVERGLTDFSISRLAKKMPWGVPVPNDSDHVMYVWFDALVNYISAIGWPSSAEATEGKPGTFYEWWPVTQFAGKDNLRQQTAMWQAMLMSVGLPSSKQIIIHGFIQSGGQKMSKSLGNVINPLDLVNKYGTDAVRYFLARHVSSFEDSDVTLEKFKEAYNAGLANGLGNLASRVMKMATTNNVKTLGVETPLAASVWPGEFKDLLAKFEIQKSIDLIWQKISEADLLIQQTEPFKLVKTNKEEAFKIIIDLCSRLYLISQMLEPFMPATSETIKQLIKENKMPEKPLFARK